jgi:hypothetical protein
VNDLSVDLGGLVTVATPSSANFMGYSVDTLAFSAGASISIEKGASCDVGYPKVEAADINAAGDLTLQKEILGFSEYKLVVSGDLTITSISGTAIASFLSGSSANNVTVKGAQGPAGYTTASGCSAGGAGSSVGGVVASDLKNMTYAAVTIENDASISLANYTKPMTLGGGSSADKPIVYFSPDTDPDTYVALNSNRTWSSAVTLVSNADVYVGDKTTVNFTGTLSGSGKSLTKLDYSAGTFTNNATSNTSATPSGSQTNPVKTSVLDGTTTDYAIVVPNETATLNGQRAGITVMSGGTLKGTGTITSGLWVNDGGHVAPGNSPGCLTVDTVQIDGEYQFELGGVDACTGYDQIKVMNATQTSPTTVLGATSVLTTSRYNGYTPKQADTFTLISVAGTQPVQGTFSGLPEGATFDQNGITFKITYKGGDGNDVVLTVMNQPTAPDTGFALISANPLVTLAVTAGAGLGLVMLARHSRPAHARAHASRRRK